MQDFGTAMLARVLEPEVMDTADEARDYDAMDHVEVNERFVADVLAAGGLPRRILDVGTGTARIPIALCARAKDVEVVAIDLADHMLTVARENILRAGLDMRVRLQRVDAKAMPYADGAFGATISNSIVHHIPEPGGVLREMWRVTAPGGLLFVRDLHRPSAEADVDRLVTLYGGTAPNGADARLRGSFDNQRFFLRASLCAALTVAEVVSLVAPLGIEATAVRMTSDRHWTLAVKKP
jgi:ubiquinone/menaquinone biosynthesis C-methylase UbiE